MTNYNWITVKLIAPVVTKTISHLSLNIFMCMMQRFFHFSANLCLAFTLFTVKHFSFLYMLCNSFWCIDFIKDIGCHSHDSSCTKPVCLDKVIIFVLRYSHKVQYSWFFCVFISNASLNLTISWIFVHKNTCYIYKNCMLPGAFLRFAYFLPQSNIKYTKI